MLNTCATQLLGRGPQNQSKGEFQYLWERPLFRRRKGAREMGRELGCLLSPTPKPLHIFENKRTKSGFPTVGRELNGGKIVCMQDKPLNLLCNSCFWQSSEKACF